MKPLHQVPISQLLELAANGVRGMLALQRISARNHATIELMRDALPQRMQPVAELLQRLTAEVSLLERLMRGVET